jgi:hypothetical protein
LLKLTLLIVAAALVGCASTREESAAVLQRELPRLVTACNTAFADGIQFGFGIVAISEGIDACDRLAKERSLSLIDPAAVDLYERYRVERANRNYDRFSKKVGCQQCIEHPAL